MKKINIFITIIICLFTAFIFSGCDNNSNDCVITETLSYKIDNETYKFQLLNFDRPVLYEHLPNKVSTLDLRNKFKVTNNSTWTLYKEYSCTNVIASRQVTLNEGNNTFYVLVENQNNYNQTKYELNIYRNHIFTAKFYNFGNIITEYTQTIEEGNYFQPCQYFSSGLEGYKQIGWSTEEYKKSLFDFNKQPTKSLNLYAYYSNGIEPVYEGSIVSNSDKTVKLIADNYSSVNTNVILTEILHTRILSSFTFKDCTQLASIVIPKNIDKIIEKAFYGCTSLKSIILPENIEIVEDNAFNGCSNLTNLIINNKIKSFGSLVFKDCSKLNSINFNGTLSDWVSISFKDLYSNPHNRASSNLYINNTNVLNYQKILSTDLNDTNSLGSFALSNFTNLKELEIPNNITSIGMATLYGCGNLEKLTLPFIGCEKRNYNEYYQYPLGYIFGETNYSNSIAVNQYYVISSSKIASHIPATYYIPNKLKCVIVSDGDIPYGAFYNCVNLSEIDILNTSYICSYAFYNCTGLTSLVLPSNIGTIDTYAFTNNTTKIYYQGNLENWNMIDIKTNNSGISNPNIYYFSDNEPNQSGNFWHYINSEIVIWNKD